MRIAVCYTAITNGPRTSDFIARFVATWQAFPPGADCDLWVACNGGPLSLEQTLMFLPVNARMFPRKNDAALDIGGYFDAVRGPCADHDMILCLGESIYFHRAGWLNRLVEARQRHGPGFYGPFPSNNAAPHLQTSAFFCPPGLLKQYPTRPSNRAERMAFEYGDQSMWRRTAARGMPVRAVTFDGEWEPRMWRMGKNILWRGDQSNLLMMNNHAQGWENAPPATRQKWSANADSPFFR